jgi:release factor glutamine methyltransferase
MNDSPASDSADNSSYTPMVSDEYAARIRRWQDNVHEDLKRRATETVEYLGRTFLITPTVQPITGTSDLLGNAVLVEVRDSDRVLDMGTGSGVNAVLAASKSSEVVAVDINPKAVECARHNARTNGVESRITVLESDVFENVEGVFNLIVFDPPFRWFTPRDEFELGTTDEGYRALRAFFRGVKGHLAPDGRVLLFFGSSGDIKFLAELIVDTGFTQETVAERTLTKEGLNVGYYTYRLSID